MKFLVDANLPRRLAHHLREQGFDVIHTLELPRANKTPDSELNRISVEEMRVVITKDSDFVHSYLLRNEPWKLLLLTAGNLTNRALEELLSANLETVLEGLSTAGFVELSRSMVVLHD